MFDIVSARKNPVKVIALVDGILILGDIHND